MTTTTTTTTTKETAPVLTSDPIGQLAASPMSVLQITAVALCILLNALDGFDVLSISFAAPGIADEWGIDRAGLGIVLSMELIGMSLGSIFLGNVADTYGRRPTVLGVLVIMAGGMLAAGLADSVTELALYRLLTGFGIGGMLAAANALTAEFANAKRRALAVILMAGGYPLGAVIGGAVASDLLVTYDWRSVFYLGAGATAVFIVLVWFLLPESPAWLAQKQPPRALERLNALLPRMGQASLTALPVAQPMAKSSFLELFSPDLRRVTLVLTIAYFAHIMTFYFILKWIPKLVVDMGFAASQAGTVLVWANVGGLLGTLLLGLLSQRFAVRSLVMLVLLAGAAMVAWFGRGQGSLGELAAIAGIAGFFTNGAVTGLYALFAFAFPTAARASGTGLVIGLGRGGAVLGPIAAGLMFTIGYGLQSVAIAMALGSVVAFFALMFLRMPAAATAEEPPVSTMR